MHVKWEYQIWLFSYNYRNRWLLHESIISLSSFLSLHSIHLPLFSPSQTSSDPCSTGYSHLLVCSNIAASEVTILGHRDWSRGLVQLSLCYSLTACPLKYYTSSLDALFNPCCLSKNTIKSHFFAPLKSTSFIRYVGKSIYYSLWLFFPHFCLST